MPVLTLDELLQRGDAALHENQHEMAVFFYSRAFTFFGRELEHRGRLPQVDGIKRFLSNYEKAVSHFESALDAFHYFQDFHNARENLMQASTTGLNLPEIQPLDREVNKWIAIFDTLRKERIDRHWKETGDAAAQILTVYRENTEAQLSQQLANKASEVQRFIAEVQQHLDHCKEAAPGLLSEKQLAHLLIVLRMTNLQSEELVKLLSEGVLAQFEHARLLQPELDALAKHQEELNHIIFDDLIKVTIDDLRTGLFDQALARLFGGASSSGQMRGLGSLCEVAGVAIPVIRPSQRLAIQRMVNEFLAAAQLEELGRDLLDATPEVGSGKETVAKLRALPEHYIDVSLTEFLRELIQEARTLLQTDIQRIHLKGFKSKKWQSAAEWCAGLQKFFVTERDLAILRKQLEQQQKRADNLRSRVEMLNKQRRHNVAARLLRGKEAMELLPEHERKDMERKADSLARGRLIFYLFLAVVLAMLLAAIFVWLVPVSLLF